MADILKISTPLVDRNAMVHPNKQAAEALTQFPMTDTTRVIKTNPQAELLKQNNGMAPREEAPAILMNLLRDPSVTVNFLKNIYLLQDIINLIPVNNEALTGEINQMFQQLMIHPDEIAGELGKQASDSTIFQGELFDMLRSIMQESGGRQDVRLAVGNLLKSMNAALSKGNILQSVGNNLAFLGENLQASKGLAEKLLALAAKFREPGAAANFVPLKNEVQALLQQVESSILFSPKMEKVLPLITYNLSRFSDNPDYLQDAANGVMNLLDGGEAKSAFLAKLRAFLVNTPTRRSAGQEYELEKPGSKVMEALVKLIGKEAQSKELTLASSEKLEKIIQSLLSTPCNFTPLLHFIVPVDQEGMRSFAEIWIDNNPEEGGQAGAEGEIPTHMLLVFDVEGIGQFEAELLVNGKKIGLNLLCPAPYLPQFTELRDYAAKIAAGTSYSFSEIYIGRLERPRSLMDVFKDLPHKRMGIDVKI